jgi:hypothetical protein
MDSPDPQVRTAPLHPPDLARIVRRVRPQLQAYADRQAGMVTRRQARAAGYTERELRTLTAVNGPWLAVRRGAYVERATWDALDPYDGRARMRDLAAHLTMTTPHLMSHDSAARALDLPMLRAKQELVHITRYGVGGTRTEHGVKHHMTQLGLLNTRVVDGMRVTGLARTALDLAREHGFTCGTVACDAALERGVDLADLEAELLPMWCWPGVTQARAAVAMARPGAESPGETLTRLLVVELDIGEPETQFPVRIGEGVAWTDLRVGCHLFEFDGRVKYRRPEQGGVADRDIEDVLWDERTRERLICGEGLGMSRVVWDDLFGRRREETKVRLRSEYELTVGRLGSNLPDHLARSAAEIRARWPRRPSGV